jgi:hypothetical protein
MLEKQGGMCFTLNLTSFLKHVQKAINSNGDFWEGAHVLGKQLNQRGEPTKSGLK